MTTIDVLQDAELMFLRFGRPDYAASMQQAVKRLNANLPIYAGNIDIIVVDNIPTEDE